MESTHIWTIKASSHNQIITSNLVGAATVVLGSNTWWPKTLRLKSPILQLENDVITQLKPTILHSAKGLFETEST